MRETPYFWKKTYFTIGFADPVLPVQCATILALLPQKIGDNYEKNAFYNDKF